MTPERYAVVRELFLVARLLGDSDQKRFLGERCAGDPALAEEVASLLSTSRGIGGGRSAGPTPPSSPENQG